MQYAEIYPISKYRGRLGDNLRDDEDFIKHLMDEYGESALELGSSRVQSIIYKEKYYDEYTEMINNGTLSVVSASDIQNLKEQNKLRYPNLEHEDSKEHEFDQFNWEKEAKEIINRNYKEKVERAVSRQDKKEKKLKNSKKHNGDKEHSAEKISKFLEENAREGQYEETQGTLAGGQWIDGQYVENDDQR